MWSPAVARAMTVAISITAFSPVAIASDSDRGDLSRLIDQLDMRRESDEQLRQDIESMEENIEIEKLITRDAEDEEEQSGKELSDTDQKSPEN